MKKEVEILNTIKLLRFPFSIFLLPVTLFSFYFIKPIYDYNVFLLLFIWHCLIFPASNGYNSYHDRDDGPIGGLGSPPRPTRFLLKTVFVSDGIALVLSIFINIYFTFFVFGYIVASRLYSHRAIRLKKYPFYSFIIVFIFQGIWVFCANMVAFSSLYLFSNSSVILAALASSFFVGTLYPITQIYQHKADRADGIRTLSMVLGFKHTFLFSAAMFAITTMLLYLSFKLENAFSNFWLFLIIMLPSFLFFVNWAWKSFSNSRHINFRNTMVMVILSSVLSNIYFIVLLLK